MIENRILARPIASHEQPDFPACDLSEANAAILSSYLLSEPGVGVQGEYLKEHQELIYYMATTALSVIDGQRIDLNSAEYAVFAHGFAGAEVMTMVVRPIQAYDYPLAATRAQELLINPGEMTDVELAEWHDRWLKYYPNSQEPLISIGESRHDTMGQLRMRLFGGHLALELQRGFKLDLSTTIPTF